MAARETRTVDARARVTLPPYLRDSWTRQIRALLKLVQVGGRLGLAGKWGQEEGRTAILFGTILADLAILAARRRVLQANWRYPHLSHPS